MNKTRIDYLTHTYNPIAMRCTPVSEGCRNCWHLRMANRLAKNPLLDEGIRDAYAGGIPGLNNEELEAPLHLRKPARIWVQFMGDLFHESVPEEFIERIYSTIYNSPEHTFFILTKRPSRMAEFHSRSLFLVNVPFENIFLGVSVEDQKTADERIPILLQIPAAHRWVSVEPMIAPISIRKWAHPETDETPNMCYDKGLDWVVAGCETGPKARPCHPDWVRSLRAQCLSAAVPFFYKNNGGIIDGKEWRQIP